VATDFTLTARAPHRSRGGAACRAVPFPAGTYTLSETGPAGYTPAPGLHWWHSGRETRSRLADAAPPSAQITNDDISNQVAPNFVRLQSDTGDFIGHGGTYEYTQANAIITVRRAEATWRSVSGGTKVVGRLPGAQHAESARTWDLHRSHALPVPQPDGGRTQLVRRGARL